MPETAKRTARVPILGPNGRISDDYIPAAIGENVTKAESAATRAETAATEAGNSASAAGTSAAQAAGSATRAQQSAMAADGSATSAKSAQTAAETAKTAAEKAKADAESASTAAANSASQAATSAESAASSVQSVADKFITSAEATTLEPGLQATAAVKDQVLELGIPKGDKGDPGDPGYTPQRGVDYWTAEDVKAVVEDAKTQAVAELAGIGNVPKKTVTDLVAHGEDAYAQKPIEVRVKGRTWVNKWPVIENTSHGVTASTDETGLITVTGEASGASGYLQAVALGLAAGKKVTLAISNSIGGSTGITQVYLQFIGSGGSPVEGGWVSISSFTTTTTTTVPAGTVEVRCCFETIPTGTVNWSGRVMLVDGTEVPDCFTPPASIASVETGKLVTSGKNLLRLNPNLAQSTTNGVTFTPQDDGGILVDGTASKIAFFNLDFNDNQKTTLAPPAGTTVTQSGNIDRVNMNVDVFLSDGSIVPTTTMNSPTAAIPNQATYLRSYIYVDAGSAIDNVTIYPQLELGSTATAYEPPSVTETPLPGVELRSLPNGTCDELVIRADGTCEVERRVIEYEVQGTETINVGEHSNGQKYASVSGIVSSSSSSSSSSLLSDRYTCGAFNTIDKYAYIPDAKNLVINDSRFTDADTAKSILASEKPKFVFEATRTEEPQSPVTLPALPAPTFNQYHDADVPSDTSTQYARDINLVLANLESVQTALLGGE